MQRWDEKTEEFMQEWTRKEIQAVIGASPCYATQDDEDDDYEPKGPNAWFGYAVSEVVHLVTLRRMSTTWRDRPPYLSWRSCAPAIRQRADEMVVAAKLLPGITPAEWFHKNETRLQQEPTNPELVRIVAAALLPLFENEPACWTAIHLLDDDMSGTLSEYLWGWHASVPEKCRQFVRRIAGEFGVEIPAER